MNLVIAKLHEAQLRKDLPEFRPGDTVRVNVRLKEGEGEKEKERLQAFEGVVISKKGRASGATFTVRRVSFGVGIERIFPLHSPTISSIQVVGKGKVRRARLYYLRDLKGKAARIKRAAREEAEPVAAASVTAEFLERWRVPGDAASRQWEERFGEHAYVPLAEAAIASAAVANRPAIFQDFLGRDFFMVWAGGRS